MESFDLNQPLTPLPSLGEVLGDKAAELSALALSAFSRGREVSSSTDVRVGPGSEVLVCFGSSTASGEVGECSVVASVAVAPVVISVGFATALADFLFSFWTRFSSSFTAFSSAFRALSSSLSCSTKD